MAGSVDPGVLWIAEHDPSLPSPHEVSVIDLRGATSDDERTAAADGLRRLLRGEQLEWPSTHRVTVDALAEAANDLVAAISARRSDLQANRRYGLQLTRELARLIGRSTTGVHSDPTGNSRQPVLPQQPAHSPDGILADVTTDEVRRIIRRLADHLDRDPSAGSRPTTGG
ncbi:MAG: hypothetical protein WCP59_15105, partial [Actinomycetota bacterium]